MAKIRLKFFVYLIAIGNEIVKSSSSEDHNPPVSEDVKEMEEISTSLSPLLTSPSSSTLEKSSDEPVTSSSKEQSLKISAGEEFNPSVYLGEIKGIESQSRISTSVPFNNLQHVRFEGSIGLEGDPGIIYRQHYPYYNNHHNNYNHYNTDHRQEESHSSYPHSPSYAEGYLTVEMPTKPVYYTSEEPNHYINVEIQPHQSLEQHKHQYPPTTKFEFEPINYHHHYSNSQVAPLPVPEVTLTRPETLLYLSSHHQTSLMKTRKFPYKYHQPNDDIAPHFFEQGHAFPMQHIRISPWKKLIHLIGAFLPIGLLLAALRPNVRVEPTNNTTQPNIVLSKWRGIELPVEHKGVDVDEDKCEDRSLCEIILIGAEENAGLIHSILWNFAIKSTDQEAQRNGLDEIFNGVKKKDCNLIRC